MTSMRERIGAAVASHFGDEDGHHPVYDGIVDAILEAMEDPTPEMQVAGGLKLEAMMFEGDPDWTGVIFTDVAHVFRAMISEARKG